MRSTFEFENSYTTAVWPGAGCRTPPSTIVTMIQTCLIMPTSYFVIETITVFEMSRMPDGYPASRVTNAV